MKAEAVNLDRAADQLLAKAPPLYTHAEIAYAIKLHCTQQQLLPTARNALWDIIKKIDEVIPRTATGGTMAEVRRLAMDGLQLSQAERERLG